MSWIVFAEFPLAEDLSQINKALNHHNIPHRFTEEQGQQRLWLPGQQFVEPVNEIIHAVRDQGYRAPEQVEEGTQTRMGMSTVSVTSVLLMHPMAVLLIALSVIGYLVVFFQLSWAENLLRFHPVLLEQGQIWRILTPVFLHFSLMHVVFNSLWLWEVGKRLELVTSSMFLLLLSVVSGVISNYAQYLFGGSINFGGASGVVYAFFGCAFVLQKFRPVPELAMPRGFYVAMFVFLLAGFTGIFEMLFGINMANWCHLFGAISGALFGFAYVIARREK